MATVTAPKTARRSRSQVAEALVELLGEEPQSAASLSRALGLPSSSGGKGVVADALAVVAARGQARRIPDSPGKRDGGWVAHDSAHESDIAAPVEIEFDYDFDKRVPLDKMFVDQSYQRPLTTFVKEIERDFDPYLFGALMLSDRGDGQLAIIDGQTRWEGARRIGVQVAPGQIFKNLTPEDEADIFWRIQKKRKGVVSWHTFRARLRSGDETAIKIKAIVEQAGYVLGEGSGTLRAMSALESTFKQSPFLLERTLTDFRSAWGDRDIPEAPHIYGLHFFFRHFPLDSPKKQDVNDERLVRRLKIAGPEGLHRKASAAKELGGRGTSARWYAQAIQGSYLSGGGSIR